PRRPVAENLRRRRSDAETPVAAVMFTDLQQRYVDLLIGALTRTAFGEGGQPVPEARQKGRDWPPEAETMIGVERCYDLAECVNTIVADNVPGDLLEAGVWRGGACILMRGVL